MKHLLILIDVFFMFRPLLLIPVWGFCIFGYYHGTMQSSATPITSLWSVHTLKMFLWFLLFSVSVASVYIFNQLADIDVDRANSGLPLLAKGKVSVRCARISAILCALIGIAGPLFRHPFLSIFSCTALALGLVYSLKPVQLSGRFILDFLANATGYGIIAFGAGWYLSNASPTVHTLLSALPYFLLMCSGSISSTIPDYQGDKKYGKKTTAVVLGIMRAHFLAAFFLCMAAAAAFLTHNTIALICSLFAIPIYGLYFIKRKPGFQEATYKVGGFLCMAMASILMPVFAITAIMVTSLTFFYFRKRHHITYPSLVPSPHED
jgi:4-hydroxybenzoate polyprenyltransferase